MAALDPEQPDPVEALLAEAETLDREAEHYVLLAEAARADAAKKRAAIDRLVNGTGVRVHAYTALVKARKDPKLAAAAVAVEGLPRGFTPTDLARALGISDTARAQRLLLALADLEKVTRFERGWMVVDTGASLVRDWIVNMRTFTFGDAVAALGMSEETLTGYLDDLRNKGIITGAGGHYEYVEPEGRTGARPRRRPPELDPPAGTERRATGTPVRIVDHGQAAKAGTRHQFKLRQKRWEAQEAAREKRAEEQRRRNK